MNTNTNTNAPAVKYGILIQKFGSNGEHIDSKTIEFTNIREAIAGRAQALKAIEVSKANARILLLADGRVTHMIFRAGIVISVVTKYVVDAFNAVKDAVVDFWAWVISLFSTEEKKATGSLGAGAEQKAAA